MMKKLLVILLCLSVLLTPVLALAEGETASPAAEEKLAGTWFAEVRGLELALTLDTGGNYTLTVGNETIQGTWAPADGGVCLDGADVPSLYLVGDKLSWASMDLYLTREAPVGAYKPADPLTEGVTAGLFDGYWVSLFVDTDGIILPASELDEKTDLYVEAPRAVLGGPLFGDVTVTLAFADGVLSFSGEDVSVTMQLQADGLMRMTLTAPSGALTLYLSRVYAEGATPAEP